MTKEKQKNSNKQNRQKAIIIVLDGLGLRKSKNANAVKLAKPKNLEKYMKIYPMTELEASGTSVGLPKGFIGNSEVGHLTLGAGRIILQDMSVIDEAIKDKSFFKNQVLLGAINHAKKHNSAVHLMGLLSDAGVHSHIRHLFALLELCKKENFTKVNIHCFTDGRDVPPNSGIKYIAMLEKKIKQLKIGRIATVCGRYYAMDRDKRWDRQQRGYDLLVHHKGKEYESAKEAVLDNYKRGITDEFIEPSVINARATNPSNNSSNKSDSTKSDSTIKSYDSVIFFNFRSDRARQLTKALTQRTFKSFKSNWLRDLYFAGMIKYQKKMRIKVIFPERKIKNTMGEWLSKHKIKQLRIAETEKYAHVTFFFNAGTEKPYPGETRILVNSPKVATYDLKPEMSAAEVKNKALKEIKTGKHGFILLNFANPDMVGHTGKLEAAIRAVKAVDEFLGAVVNAALAEEYNCIILADHGNCEEMKGRFKTSHTLNKVPLIIVSNNKEFQKEKIKLEKGFLYDIGPTTLEIMKIQKPLEMTGKSLIKSKAL